MMQRAEGRGQVVDSLFLSSFSTGHTPHATRLNPRTAHRAPHPPAGVGRL